MHRKRYGLLIVFIVYCALAIFYAVLTPPWESPDEPAHYVYVAQLASSRRPPTDPGIRQQTTFSQDYPFISSNYEWYHPAPGYFPAVIVYGLLQRVAPSSLPWEIAQLNPRFGVSPSGDASLFLHADQRPLHVWRGQWGLLAIRIVTSLLGLAVIYATYQTGCLLDGHLLGLVAAAWVAFLPQFTFITSSIRSDTAANAVGALVFYRACLLQFQDEAQKHRSALIIGVLMGVGLLTKYTFLFVPLVIIPAVLFARWHSAAARFKAVAFVLTPMLLSCGLYCLAYDEARAALIHALTAVFKIDTTTLSLNYLFRVLRYLLIDLFFARFGWANVLISNRASGLAFCLWLAGAAMTLVQFFRHRKQPSRQRQLRAVAVLIAGLLAAFAGVVGFNLSVFQPQGRFLFPALAAWAVTGFWGLWQILGSRGRLVVGSAALGSMLLFNLYALVRLAWAYY